MASSPGEILDVIGNEGFDRGDVETHRIIRAHARF
jgi:hypothetical protein